MDKCNNFEEEGAKEKIEVVVWKVQLELSRWFEANGAGAWKFQQLLLSYKTASVMMIELLKQLAKLLTLAKGWAEFEEMFLITFVSYAWDFTGRA